jgi:hypothetical protein
MRRRLSARTPDEGRSGFDPGTEYGSNRPGARRHDNAVMLWRPGSFILGEGLHGGTMSRRTGSRARLKSARRIAKNPGVKKRKPIERPTDGQAPSSDTFTKR